MDEDYDYENAPEANGWAACDEAGSDQDCGDYFEYDPEWNFDEEVEIQKAERSYERYIGRS